eukprot:TRINITY_DN33536_c0_g1_i1.p1 TRINITY_DN33536_c0_g1~~TRINITY_DN33536_c0_g1_i1.p1  ORF type:complete len:129 (+),score=14.36 TRINITY_DN33536_c0_g1_i1:270-656(+)
MDPSFRTKCDLNDRSADIIADFIEIPNSLNEGACLNQDVLKVMKMISKLDPIFKYYGQQIALIERQTHQVVQGTLAIHQALKPISAIQTTLSSLKNPRLISAQKGPGSPLNRDGAAFKDAMAKKYQMD